MNTVQDPSFDKSGYYIDSLKPTFEAKAPKALGFFVEVSGSMNGFFRSNRATQFKKDIWSIVSNFGNQEVFFCLIRELLLVRIPLRIFVGV